MLLCRNVQGSDKHIPKLYCADNDMDPIQFHQTYGMCYAHPLQHGHTEFQ